MASAAAPTMHAPMGLALKQACGSQGKIEWKTAKTSPLSVMSKIEEPGATWVQSGVLSTLLLKRCWTTVSMDGSAMNCCHFLGLIYQGELPSWQQTMLKSVETIGEGANELPELIALKGDAQCLTKYHYICCLKCMQLLFGQQMLSCILEDFRHPLEGNRLQKRTAWRPRQPGTPQASQFVDEQ